MLYASGCYIAGGGGGVLEIGLGAAGALGAVKPGMMGACDTVPAAASVMLIP